MVEERACTRGKVNATVLGFASAGGERINLAPPICRAVGRVASRRALPDAAQPAFALALAVATLAHESMHAEGVADEAEAACSGIQWLARAARALGADDDDGQRRRRVHWPRYASCPRVPVRRSAGAAVPWTSTGARAGSVTLPLPRDGSGRGSRYTWVRGRRVSNWS